VGIAGSLPALCAAVQQACISNCQLITAVITFSMLACRLGYIKQIWECSAATFQCLI